MLAERQRSCETAREGENVLPKNLSEIKQRLESKGYSQRTGGEDDLLQELAELDRLLETEKFTIRKSAKDSFFSETRIVGGSGGVCKCCGR